MEPMINQVYPIRQLVGFANHHTFDDLPERFTILFEDGVELPSTRRELIYSNYFWDMHRRYPNTPITSRHHVQYVLKGKPLKSTTHMRLLSIINRDIAKTYNLTLPIEVEKLAQLNYEITNNIYNDVSELAEAYVTSIDILDFIEIIDHPKVKLVVDNTEETEASIEQCYIKIKKILLDDPELKHNAVVKYLRSETVNMNQILQCVAVRGFLTEVNGEHFLTPVMSNFTKGLNRLHDFIVESRSAAKSLLYAETKIRDSEYFARRLQLLAMVIESINYEDCGSTTYLNWRANPDTRDLAYMIGKNYLDEETGQLKQIEFEDPALYNKVLKLRSVLYCRTKNPHQVCHVCFGGLSLNVSRFANLGHVCATTMTAQSTGSLLATKHLMASSVAVTIELSESALKVFRLSRAKNLILLNENLADKQVKLTINREDALALTDIFIIEKIENINPTRISDIKDVDVTYTTKEGEVVLPVNVEQSNRNPILTKQLLEYLKKYRWEVDSRNNFVFDMSHWDFSQPILRLRETEYSYSDHSKQLAKVIESNMKDIADRTNPESPVVTLQQLFNLVNSKLNVNLAALEVLILANMVTGKDQYDLARNSPTATLDVSSNLIKNRSLSNAMAYQEQYSVITNPMSFFKRKRPDSVFDVCICPKEVEEHKEKMRTAR